MKSAVRTSLALSAFALCLPCFEAQAQQQAPQSPNMTFFVTGAGPGKGADVGGLEGADRQCQELAQRAEGTRQATAVAALPPALLLAPGDRVAEGLPVGAAVEHAGHP